MDSSYMFSLTICVPKSELFPLFVTYCEKIDTEFCRIHKLIFIEMWYASTPHNSVVSVRTEGLESRKVGRDTDPLNSDTIASSVSDLTILGPSTIVTSDTALLEDALTESTDCTSDCDPSSVDRSECGRLDVVDLSDTLELPATADGERFELGFTFALEVALELALLLSSTSSFFIWSNDMPLAGHTCIC